MAKKEAEVHGIRIKETRADRTFNVLNLIFWILVLFITLYPLWLVLIASVSDPDAVLAGEVLFWPKGFSLMGYEAVFQHSELWQSYLNSIIYTVLGSALSVIVSLAAAYSLSRKFAGKAFVNFLITFTMFFSGGLIPIFLNVRDLGLYDTRLVMILMNTVSVWNLMVARTYIQSSIPNELYEAAVMDGADHFTYFFRCVLPLSGTIIAVLSVYYGVARWNDYFTGLVFIRNRAYLPLQTVLREILASLSISGSSDTFFAAYADNLGGLQEAMRKADPTLLEPIMKVCVIVPDEYMGDVIGDLNSRRGQIQGFEARSGAQQIDAFVPLAEMFGYATDLRSCTQGRGQYTMEPAHYIEIPKNIQEKIINQRTNRA